MSEPHWFLVFRPDGVVVEASGGAPPEFVGENLRESDIVPAPICAAAADLLLDARTSPADAWLFRATVENDGEDRPLTDLLLVEAVPLRREATPLAELLIRTTETLMEQARATHVNLKVDADDGMPTKLPIDGEKIAWGVAALVGSALRHVGSAPGRDKMVHVEARYDERSRSVVISVRDNGPGIPSGKLQWLVTRDPRTQKAAGLALLLLKDVVAAHGGRMDVESSTEGPDHGTRVTLHLPIE
jgi:signal transduction histidine kinase